jgi:pantetheine-phosphate adenylyltransferase
MTTAVVPGSFDPPTLGHLDVIQRAADIFETVVVAVLVNPLKVPMFTVEERMAMLTEISADYDNVSIDSFQGLMVEFAKKHAPSVIVKGLRVVSDFEYELQMAQMNRHLEEVETIFVPTSAIHGYLSSSLVKDVARFGGKLTGLVPPVVETALRNAVDPD